MQQARELLHVLESEVRGITAVKTESELDSLNNKDPELVCTQNRMDGCISVVFKYM